VLPETTEGDTTQKRSRPVFAMLAVAAIGGLLLAERRSALRRTIRHRRGEEAKRLATNLVMAGLTTAITAAAMAPVIEPLTRWAERERVGLTQRLPLRRWMRDVAAILLLDYTLYWWHVVEHRSPWLYRFHQVHHADLELDVSTAARFHFGEFLASVPWRAAQVVLIGASPRALALWQRLTMLSVLFHHSNVRLPLALERRLARVFVTPRLHGIHHSIVREEQDSNWSSGLAIWDWLHGTYRADVAQSEIEIGVPAYRNPEDVTLSRSLAMPMHPLPPWQLPDGTVPRHRTARTLPNVLHG
jgi:sterol desaturase/sphingolipid hydroxylase (fatty acid hydroxylase superfamily)